MLACAAASMALGVAMSTDTRTSGTTIMDVDAVKDTVGDGVPPGADAEGSFFASATVAPLYALLKAGAGPAGPGEFKPALLQPGQHIGSQPSCSRKLFTGQLRCQQAMVMQGPRHSP